MTGAASWEQIWLILGIAGAALAGGYLVAWRISLHLSANRALIETRVETALNGLELRIRAMENFNAGTVVMLEHMETFREEVHKQYEQLRKERKYDMESIHRRLDAIHNAARLVQVGADLENNEEE